MTVFSRITVKLWAGLIAALVLFAGDVVDAQESAGLGISQDSIQPDVKTDLISYLAALRDSEDQTARVQLMATSLAQALSDAADKFSAAPRAGKPELLAMAAKIRQQNPRAKKLLAHIYSIALELDPDDVDLAYEIEVLKIAEGAELKWDEKALAAASKPKVEEPAVMIPEPVSFPEDEGIGRTQSLVKGLLVQQLEGSQFAGAASQMNATALKVNDDIQWQVGFNQRVGEMMSGALERVVKFQNERHEPPKGFKVEISFEEQYVPKDGPSAAVACSLLLESLIKDIDFDPAFAVTGDMDDKGKVGVVGGVDGKIRGAARRKCEIIAIPAGNHNVISDLLILEGPKSISNIQIFSIEEFKEALDLALEDEERPEALRQAIGEFKEIQSVVKRSQGSAILRNSKVQAKLRKIVEMAPNHLSARLLLLKGLGKEPKQLSLPGSLLTIDRAAAPLIRAISNGKFEQSDSSLDSNEYADAISKLRRVRAKLDARTHKCADAIIDYSGFLSDWVNDRPNSRTKQIELVNNIRITGERVGREFDALNARADVKEELRGEEE